MKNILRGLHEQRGGATDVAELTVVRLDGTAASRVDQSSSNRTGNKPARLGDSNLAAFAIIAPGHTAGDIGGCRALKEHHTVGRAGILKTNERRKGTDTKVRGFPTRILQPQFLYVAIVFFARAAEVEEHAIFKIAESLAADTDACPAKGSAVGQIARARRIRRGARPAQIGGDWTCGMLKIVGDVELHDPKQIGRETAIARGNHRMARVDPCDSTRGRNSRTEHARMVLVGRSLGCRLSSVLNLAKIARGGG